MTQLEYAIMESERYGEIDVETRDNLLGILEAASEYENEDVATDDEIMEHVDDLRLRVYEAYEEGTISEEEKDTFLEYLNPENYE